MKVYVACNENKEKSEIKMRREGRDLMLKGRLWSRGGDGASGA